MSDRRATELVDTLGSARAVLDTPGALGDGAERARGSRPLRDRVARSLAVLERDGVRPITFRDPDYPPALRHLHDPPLLLFARGRLELLARPAAAVVGARRHTAYGRDVTRAVAGTLSRAGAVVISGLARGIDAIAHEAALDGGTIAVLGCGIDVAYPPEHADLQRRVAERGLLLSEFAPGEPALRYHFPRRNRLIAALARVVVVVEASARSGSLITVEHALDLGREVLAVPGPIGRPTSEGTNALIRDGARVVTRVEEVLEPLGLAVPAGVEGVGVAVERGPPPARASQAARALWAALSEEPAHVDALAEACGLAVPAALAALLELELGGRARQLPGKRFVRG